MYKFAIGFAWMVITFWGCTNDINDLGKELLPVGDLIHVGKVTEKATIRAYTVTDEKQRTDKPTYNLLGTFNDPIFGKTTADFACQLRLGAYPSTIKTDIIDSLVFYLSYTEFYGDTITPQKIKVYELASDLADTKYYQDINLKALAKSEVLAEYSHIPKLRLDSLSNTYGSTKVDPKDTVTQQLAIKINPSLIQKIVAADSATLSSNDVFLKYFKGLYIEAGDLSQGGTIMQTTPRGMIMYSHNSKDTIKTYFSITQNSVYVNRFAHDYSSTPFAANLDQEETMDSLIYLQTTGGLRNKIMIPNLGSWSDSTNYAINKAELIFQVDTTATDIKQYSPPKQLVLSAIGVDKDGKETEYLPSDVAFSSVYYGGTYNSKDKTYRFNIAKHMQEVIDNMQEVIDKKTGKENLGFYLSTAFRSATFSRTVLKGATSKTGIRLEITYSKLK